MTLPRIASQGLIASLLPVLGAAIALPNNTSSHSNSSLATTIEWSKCQGPVPLQTPVPDSVDCGKIRVPLNHHNLGEHLIELGMMRLKARGPNPQGTLFYNSGGPGDKLIHQQALWEEDGVKDTLPMFSDALRSSFDIIGLDMRGEGLSALISCDKDLYNTPVSWMEVDDDSFKALKDHNRALGESYSRMTGPLFGKTGTDQRVRDLEIVRNAAIGDEKLNWIGWSYGSQLGIEYAEMFPERVGRFVMDGNTPKSLSPSDSMVMSAVAGHEALGPRPTIWEDLVSAAEISPLRAPSCKESGKCFETVTAEQLIATTIGLMNSGEMPNDKVNFQTLAEQIKMAHEGGASGLSQTLVESNTALSDITIGNTNAVCLDYDGHSIRSAAELRATYHAGREWAPRVRGISLMWGFHARCIGWPAEATNPPHELDPKQMSSLPPIMLVHGLHDQATPISFEVTRATSTWARLLEPSMDEFLVNGTIPKDGTVYDT